MKEHVKISNAVVKRLPIYLRYLEDLMKNNVERISSNELSSLIGFTASQIRQDLNNFGGFGQQGYGYNIKGLYKEINSILGLDREYRMVIVGTGNLGQALANYVQFEKRGFKIIGLFDVNPVLEGVSVRGIEIQMMDRMEDFIRENDVEIATLTLPKAKAVETAERLVKCGIKAIWNFAHTDLNLTVPSNVIVENVHLSESLMRLSYNLNHYQREHGKEKD